jgi:hypothetical protein
MLTYAQFRKGIYKDSIGGKVSFDTKKDGSFSMSLTLPANQFGNPQGLRFEYIDIPNPTKCTLKYRVFVPRDFTPVKGGKLFGFNTSESCTRLMFVRESLDKTKVGCRWYLYAPTQKDPNYTQLPGYKQNDEFGDSVYEYYYWLNKGEWNTIEMTVQLNTPGEPNGMIDIAVNNTRYKYFSYIFRDFKSTFIQSVLFCCFFGGSDASWAPKSDQTLIFDSIDIQ